MIAVSYLVDCDTWLQNAADIITKCDKTRLLQSIYYKVGLLQNFY